MATSNNFVLKNLSGHIGKQLIFKHYGDKTVVSKYPDMGRRKFTARQLHNQSAMEEANAYAQTVLADKDQRQAAQVRLDVTANKLYTALIKEYYSNLRAAREQTPA